MDINSESLDYLNDDALEYICEQMNNQTLYTLLHSYKRSVSVCSKVLEKRRKTYESEFFSIPANTEQFAWVFAKLNQDLISFFSDALKAGLLKGPHGERIKINNILSGYSTYGALNSLIKIYLLNNGKSTSVLNISSDRLLNRWFSYLEEPPLNYDIKRIDVLIELTTENVDYENLSENQRNSIINEKFLIEALFDLWIQNLPQHK